MEIETAITTLEAMAAVAESGSLGRDACNMAIKALEKQIPKPYIEEFRRDCGNRNLCPRCEHIFGIIRDHKFCWNCGQAIDWSEVE